MDDEVTDELEEFYRGEIDLINDFEREIGKRIMPQQYWGNHASMIFATTEYERCFDDYTFEEYNQLCYLIKLGEGVSAFKMVK